MYLGIPQFVLDWRPSRPGPKMSAFLAVTTVMVGAYAYDRKECSRLQQEYIEQVKFLSEAKLDATELARVVKVYGARVPEDGDEQRSTVWFKRYMRVSYTVLFWIRLQPGHTGPVGGWGGVV